MWDPGQYERYGDERARPFADLLAQVDVPWARRVVDLGCGTAALTASLLEHWPAAHVLGIDSSLEMLAAAAPRSVPGRLELERADIRDYEPDGEIDVFVSNAALQWVPDHIALLQRLAGALAPGGVLAIQVPGNSGSLAHRLLAKVASGPRWCDTAGAALSARPGGAEPARYLEALTDAGLLATVWETTYVHVLRGDHAVLEWMRGTALRPVLQALRNVPPDASGAPSASDAFVAEYGAALDAAYPPSPLGTISPFRRIFAVGRRPGRPSRAAVTGLDHVQLAMPAGREDEARRFYAGLLGLAELRKPSPLAARGGCWFAGHRTQVHLGVDPDFRPARKAHVALVATELDELVARLTANGVRVTSDDESLAPRHHVYAEDPFGNRVELLAEV